MASASPLSSSFLSAESLGAEDAILISKPETQALIQQDIPHVAIESNNPNNTITHAINYQEVALPYYQSITPIVANFIYVNECAPCSVERVAYMRKVECDYMPKNYEAPEIQHDGFEVTWRRQVIELMFHVSYLDRHSHIHTPFVFHFASSLPFCIRNI